MRWADQLIKLSNFELELLQARLADVGERRRACGPTAEPAMIKAFADTLETNHVLVER